MVTGRQGETLSIDRYDGRVVASATAALHAELLNPLNA
jgi:hypothetical protein